MLHSRNHSFAGRAWLAVATLSCLALTSLGVSAQGEEQLPWLNEPARSQPAPYDRGEGSYVAETPARDGGYYEDAYRRAPDAAVPAERTPPPGYIDNYRSGRGYVGERRDDAYTPPYEPPRQASPERAEPYDRAYGRGVERGPYADNVGPPYRAPPPYRDPMPQSEGYGQQTYSEGEISRAGHRFFGSVSRGLASVIEYAFKQSGRPNGYILGEDAGGAFVAGLRYGEGVLYTKDAGSHKVYWQGPSVGYDFGAEGSKTMVLVYNLRDPSEIYHRFGGVQGSAYVVGGVSIQFQKYGDVVLAPIRSGVGLRLGANVGYLKYTRSPTWNPF